MIRDAARTFLCIVDLQEKLMPAMGHAQETLRRVKILLGGAGALGIPFLATEQYPRGLCGTLPEIRELFPADTAVLEKNSFSCFGAPGFPEAAEKLGRKVMILCGVEAHVCVFQTALDALERGYEVYLAEDATDSRHDGDKESALRLLRDAGVTVLTVEMLLFLLLGNSAHPAFKTISKLVR